MNIDNIIADIQYINKVTATLIPVITDQVKTAEAVLGAGNGADKLKFVLAAVQAIYTAANGPVPFANILALVTQIVNAAVEFYNAIQAFPKAKAAA
jgi:hypothetical protein